MRFIWIGGLGVLAASAPLNTQQTVTVDRVADGYVVHTRQTFADGSRVFGDERVPPVPELLREFAFNVKNPSDAPGRPDVLVGAHHQLFPEATVDSLLAGYEAMATDPNEDVRVARAAIVAIAMLGSSQSAHPVRGQTRRLLRIYSAGDRERKSTVLWELGNATERPVAVSFLRGVATQAPSDDSERFVLGAIRALALLGNEGAAALRELDRTAAVRDPSGRFALRAFARRGYRSRP